MLSLNNITYHIGGRTILEDVQLQLDSGHRGGLIGRNGSGKSTLFKIILGEIEADTGQIQIAKNLRIVTVAQEVPHGELTPVEYLLNSDIERKTLMDELETCDDPNRLGDIYDRLISMDAYSADSRASIILKGLGFSEEDQKKQLSEFSGGFRMRIALAAALFRNPDLLLLDEPTNHLDFESILWLEEFLQKYTGSLLLISHDREFLNKVTNHIFHLNKGKVITYKGNYDVYEQKYRLQLEADISYNKKIEAQKAHMQKFVDRFKAKATKAKQAQSRVKAINKLNPIALIFVDPASRLNFPE
ncbi:MAG: ABC-F family ATP-binding cassette domain-containing protein, partial [Alphaproteobacteria bacterium]